MADARQSVPVATGVKVMITQDNKAVAVRFKFDNGTRSVILSPKHLPGLIKELFAAMVEPGIALILSAAPGESHGPAPLIVLPTIRSEADTEPYGEKVSVWFHLPGGVGLAFLLLPAEAEALAKRISSAAQRARNNQSSPRH